MSLIVTGWRAQTAKLIGCAIMLAANLSFAKDDDGRVKALFQKLEGKWRVVSAEISGQKIESDEEWRFKSGGYKWIDSKREMRGYASINYTWNPHQICFHHQHSSATGPIETDTRNWDSGIYKLTEDGETLTVCLGQLPSQEFTTTKKDKRKLYVLKRIRDDSPPK
ncbi:MAG: hypothetical protein U0905_12185 [Pirellulales bacterium]